MSADTTTAGATAGARAAQAPAPGRLAPGRGVRILLRVLALGWVAALLALPIGVTAWRTFEHGVGPVLDALSSPQTLSALRLTLLAAAIAVPLNTAFGVVCALLIVRGRLPGRAVLSALLDLPFAVSPVVLGLALFQLYGREGWLGGWLADHGVQVVFATPGIVLATVFVSLPYVVNELVPVLDELGTDQEDAAGTLGARAWATFVRITLPGLRWGLAYGVVLTTARALGEYGAVAVVSGNISGATQTLTVLVDADYTDFDLVGAYSAALLLALIAVAVLLTMLKLTRRKEDT